MQPYHLTRTPSDWDEGHAVVITGESQDSWFIKNSWGEGFAEEGFFRVAKNSIEFSFYDVCFRMCDLTRLERNAYRLAPPMLEVTIVPCRSERNPISSLGWDIDFETLRIERVRKRNCSIASWNRQNPYKKIYPGYQIGLVNGFEDKSSIISELQTAEVLQMTLIVMSTVSKLDDMFDDSARRYSYAHTIAATIRKTQARIFARTVELHEDIVDELVQKWGTTKIDVHAALQESCNKRGLHFSILCDQSAAQELSREQGRDLLASFSLNASAWKRFSDFFVEHPGSVMRASDIQNDATLPQQTAVVQVSGQGQSMRGEHWLIQDPRSGHEEDPILLRISKKAINFAFYDMYFYIRDLSPREIHLFSYAPQELAFRIKRQRHWVRGIESLGFNVNERTLQIEWVASWSPIEKQYNMHVDELHRIYAGHIIVNVNNHVERDEILDRLNKAAVLTILVSKPC